MIFSGVWWRATLERSISTAAQAALLAWGGGTLPDVSLPWWTVLAAAGGGFVLAVIKCIAASNGGQTAAPSFNDAERLNR